MTIKIFLLVTIVFFSTGFTSIVKYCSMCQSSVCCCDMDNSYGSAKQPHRQLIVGQDCMTVKVVGGLSDTRATVNTEVPVKSLTMNVMELISDENPGSTFTHYFPHSYTNDLPPPNGDICIRIKSLLI